MRPEDKIREFTSAITVAVCTANREAALVVLIGLLDALDAHEIALVPVAPTPTTVLKARAFPARYRGRCDLCGCSIEIDDMVIKAQSPRRGVDHAACADR